MAARLHDPKCTLLPCLFRGAGWLVFLSMVSGVPLHPATVQAGEQEQPDTTGSAMRIAVNASQAREIAADDPGTSGRSREVVGPLWEIEGSGLADLRPHGEDRRVLTATLGPKQAGATLIALRPAKIGDLALRWPVGLAEPFEACAELPCTSQPAGPRPKISLYYRDPLWRFHDGGSETGLSLPAEAADDLTEVGICLRWPEEQAPLAGSLAIRIDRLILRASPRHEPPMPPEGDRVTTLGPDRTWRPDNAYLGVTAIGPENGRTVLTCNLDSKDPRRRSGIAWVDVRQSDRPIDLARQGPFVTVRGPVGMKCRVGVGLGDAGGNVFWCRGRSIVAADEPTTVGGYPEMRFPLPSSFRSERFDSRRVAAVGVRVSVGSDKPERITFAGPVAIDDLRIVALPDEVRSRYDRIAERIGPRNWMNTLTDRAADKRPAPVPLEVFLQHLGVNYPWLRGVYPSVGRRIWDPTRGGFSAGVDQLLSDFDYLTRHHVRLVRVFLFCDGRTGFVEDAHGPVSLDPMVIPDLQALLKSVERFNLLRLIPVLFNFDMADRRQREDLGLVGEHPDWITDEAKRARLFEAIRPALELLCPHPQVACIDLMNEPEHAAAVHADDLHRFFTELVQRLRRYGRNVPLTVGSASALFAPFWLSTGIDFPTCHWFQKIELSHPLGHRSAALDPNAAIMTEVDPAIGVETALTTLWQSGFRGALFWSLNATDEYAFRDSPAESFRLWVEAHRR